MLTQNFFINAHEPDGNLSKKTPGYLIHLLVKAKKISQIIAYIWSFEDELICTELDKYFKIPDDKNYHIKDLLGAQLGEPQYVFLKKVFKDFPNALPIFNKEEVDSYNFRVTYNGFEGFLSDPVPGDKAAITLVIPYPPRPRIYDGTSTDPIAQGAPLKKTELTAWLKSNPDEAPYYFPTNPYIPTTCC
jgi:hypothetical protein